MNIEKPYTPELLSTCGKLVIPIYQRLFVWENERIRKLLDDLANSFIRNPESNYYIGAITICEKQNGEWEVVDGQQRLTFLTLLGCMLSNRAGEEAGDKWRRFVMCGDLCRVKYIGREDDEHTVRVLLRDGTLGKTQNERFRGFADTFTSFVNLSGKEFDLAQFSDYCWAKTAFLVNRLPVNYKPYDLNLYFEKMNSTGRQLAPIDVVKGRWFSSDEVVGRWNRCLNFDREYDRLVDEEYFGEGIDEELTVERLIFDTDKIRPPCDGKKSEVDLGRIAEHRLVMKPEVMLLHVLSVCVGDDVSLNPNELINTFAKHFDSGTMTKGEFVSELELYRKWLDVNVIYLKDIGGASEYAFREFEFNDDDAVSVASVNFGKYDMLQFQSMLYVSSGETQKWVLDAYRACRDSGETPRSLDIELLKAQDRARHQLDADTMTYHSIDRYWFWRIDYELWRQYRLDSKEFTRMYLDGKEFSPQQDRAVLGYRFRRNVSIEHLHPQSKGDKDWGSREDSSAKMHRLGNLAMMSVEANSSQSDDEIETKFGRVNAWIRAGRLESLKLLVMFILSSGRQEGWTVDLAENHRDQVLGLLKDKAGF